MCAVHWNGLEAMMLHLVKTWLMRKRMALQLAFLPLTLFAQPAGTFQIQFMDVGQGDGAVPISPQGETVLFDTGLRSFDLGSSRSSRNADQSSMASSLFR